MTPRVRRETATVGADGPRLRLLYATDLHLGLPWTKRVAEALATAADAEAPDAVLLGGDLVDRARGLGELEDCVRALAARRPVAAVAGNHDPAAGLAAVRGAVV
ncbi:MAG TPA: metallophosphoesterase, partial [Planctomycetota bacterium]|nr:metallophosphoesterase [Planctomycetota bacterium]